MFGAKLTGSQQFAAALFYVGRLDPVERAKRAKYQPSAMRVHGDLTDFGIKKLKNVVAYIFR